MKGSVQILLKADRIPSVNNMYEYSKGRVRRSQVYWDLINLAEAQLKELTLDGEQEWILHPIDFFLKVSINVIFHDRFESRDLDNTVKCIQDIIFNHFNHNDALVVELECKKFIRRGGDYEYILVSIDPSDHDPYFFEN